MAERGHGGIILLSSVTGFAGCAHMSVYSASKAFSRVFAEGLWLEMRERGVDVLGLVAGVTRTPAMERAGLHFDTPGLQVSEPAEVAREALEILANGPGWVGGDNCDQVTKLSGSPRGGQVVDEAGAVVAMMGQGV